MKSIGKGIIGSSNEESGRKIVSWNERKGYVIPSNGGKALGWIHMKSQVEGDPEPKGHVILYTIKIPVSNLAKRSAGDEEGENGWVRSVCEICRNILPMSADELGEDGKQSNQSISIEKFTGIPISADDCRVVEKLLTGFGEAKNNS